MIEGPILEMQRFRHLRTGTVYQTLRGVSKAVMKLGDNKLSDWDTAVIYFDPSKPLTFVRDESTFRKNFERV